MVSGREEDTGGDRAWSPLSLWPLAVLAVAAATFFALGLNHLVTFENFRARHAELQALVRDHYILAVSAFIGLYIAMVALSIPGVALVTLAGGFLFGTAVGFVCVVLAATIGGTLVFVAARSALGGLLKARAAPWIQRLERRFHRDQWSLMFFLRLMPIIPFFVVNLAPAFLGVTLTCFVVATFLGIMPATFVYALAGAGIGDALDAGSSATTLATVLSPKLLLGLIGLALLAVLPAVYRRLRYGKRVDSE